MNHKSWFQLGMDAKRLGLNLRVAKKLSQEKQILFALGYCQA